MGQLMLEGNRIGLYQGSKGSGLVIVLVGLTTYTKLCDGKATSAEHATMRKSEPELTNIQVVLIRQRF